MSTANGTSTLMIELPEDVLSLFAGAPEAFAREIAWRRPLSGIASVSSPLFASRSDLRSPGGGH